MTCKSDIGLVHQMLERSAVRYPDKPAIICKESRVSYSYINQKAEYLAKGLARVGVHKRGRVVICLSNSVESIIALFGVLKAGATFVMLNEGLKENKLKYILNDTEAQHLICSTSKRAIISSSASNLPKLRHVIWVSSKQDQENNKLPIINNIISYHWRDIIRSSRTSSNCHGLIDTDLAALIYTSGSSGVPKGVMSAHYNILSAVNSINQYLENSCDDIILNLLPLSFDYGLYQIFLAFQVGATIVMENNFSYPYQLLETIRNESVSGLPIVPTIAAILSQLKNSVAKKCPRLRYITNTGDALSLMMIEKIGMLFPDAKIFSMYGLTECKRATYLSPEQIKKRPTSVGKAIPNCSAFIVNSSGDEVGPDEIGELVIRGSNVMQGYWNKPDATQKVFRHGRYRADALLYTGDLFRKDDEGYLFFLGRKDNILKVKGERVSPKEIEDFINTINGVIQTTVVGLPDDIIGRIIIAYVILEKDSSLSSDDIIRQCRENLEAIIVPAKVKICKRFPSSLHGKVNIRKFKEVLSV